MIGAGLRFSLLTLTEWACPEPGLVGLCSNVEARRTEEARESSEAVEFRLVWAADVRLDMLGEGGAGREELRDAVEAVLFGVCGGAVADAAWDAVVTELEDDDD